MGVETGMYLYPWDIGGSFADFTAEYARLGLNAVAPALSYHHASVLSARSGRTYRLPDAAVAFAPTGELYGRLKPEVHGETVRKGTARLLRDWCRNTGRHFCGWTVVLHNSTLGRRHPDACCQNAFGDRYTHALCLSHPEVRRYAEALVRDICLSLEPDSLMLESATVPSVFHGEHHEIANVKLGPAAEWLYSLCFCPDCMRAAGETDGVDSERARADAVATLQYLLNNETAIPGNGQAQLAMLLLEYPALYAYQRARQAGVAAFVRSLSGVIRDHGVQCKLIPAARPYPATSVFLEGLSYAAVASDVDTLVPLVYGEGETFASVQANVRLAGADTPVGMAMTLHPSRFPDRGGFLGAVADAARCQAGCAYFYNYSIASQARLEWVAEAAAIMENEA